MINWDCYLNQLCHKISIYQIQQNMLNILLIFQYPCLLSIALYKSQSQGNVALKKMLRVKTTICPKLASFIKVVIALILIIETQKQQFEVLWYVQKSSYTNKILMNNCHNIYLIKIFAFSFPMVANLSVTLPLRILSQTKQYCALMHLVYV